MFYRLYKDVNQLWRWRYVSSNGRTIADSGEGYYNRADALNGVTLMKASYNSPVRE